MILKLGILLLLGGCTPSSSVPPPMSAEDERVTIVSIEIEDSDGGAAESRHCVQSCIEDLGKHAVASMILACATRCP